MIKSSNDDAKQVSKTEDSKNIIEELSSKTEENELNISQSLRPKKLDNYIGQGNIIDQVKIILESSKKRKVLPEHVLLYGPPGLGKTTLANIIASELECDIKFVSAPGVQKTGDLVSILISIERPTVIFIDEIHRLRTQIEETLYTAMEDYQVDLMLGKGQGISSTRIEILPFVIIGATTQLGKITKPLLDRFPTKFKMESYTDGEIKKLVEGNLATLGVKMESKAVDLLCTRSRGVPRVANNIMKRIVDLQVTQDIDIITEQQTKDFLEQMGVHKLGLTKADIDYLKSIQDNPIGIRTISSVLNEEIDTIEQTIEPYLISLGFVDKTSLGRKTTNKGNEYLKNIQ